MTVLSFKPYTLVVILCIGAGLACGAVARQTSADPAPVPSGEEGPKWLKPERSDNLEGAALAPLNDLNLRKLDIPEILTLATQAPYDLKGLDTCKALAGEIGALDQVLEPDFDVQIAAIKATAMQKGERIATTATVGAVRSASTGIIPFRGFVRKVTGAEQYQREVDTAIQAGVMRRSFLKGVGMSKNCAPPAAPAGFVPHAQAYNNTKASVSAKSKP
jgi:hypothetical protein